MARWFLTLTSLDCPSLRLQLCPSETLCSGGTPRHGSRFAVLPGTTTRSDGMDHHLSSRTPSPLYEKNTENDENDDKRVKLLLEKGADVESKEGYGGTPLWRPSGMGTRPSSNCFNENLDNYETTLFFPSGK
ncbi:hypothetical protein EDB80DRAFT_732828 [Ilyonectria destructans]|nr:hypothetical protein EDB80DRAFT_732828 [Ilyonectria destructans]